MDEVPFTGTLPRGSHLDMRGKLSLTQEGQLVLALDQPCTAAAAEGPQEVCDMPRLQAITVIAATPWGRAIRGTWTDASHVRFAVDWKHDGVDPLAPDVAIVVARPWQISGVQWTPNQQEARQILSLSATRNDPDTADDGPNQDSEHSNLEVGFEVVGGTLQAGGDTTIVVRVANHGVDVAQGVVATTRSSIDALHDQRLDFGSIDPASEDVRRFHVAVPATEVAPDTMILLLVSEAGGSAPRKVKRRVSIAPAKPVLSAQCSIVGKTAGRVEVDAGETVTVRCVVENTGTAAAKVELNTVFTGGVASRAPTREVPVGGRAQIDVQVTVPRDLPIGATADLLVSAQDRPSSSVARTKLAMVRKPKLCTPGQLTRAQYKTKLAGLRTGVANGILTQAQFDRYDAELLACLPGPSAPKGRSSSTASTSP